jgi:hypothetical protein
LDGAKDTNVNFGDRFRKRVDESRKKRDNSKTRLLVMLAILALLVYLVSR